MSAPVPSPTSEPSDGAVPAAPDALGHLGELLIRAAGDRSGPPLLLRVRDVDGRALELEVERVDDLHEALLGTTVAPEWHGFGCVAAGRARSLGDTVAGSATGEVLGAAVAALVVWRDGTVVSCFSVDGGEPRVQVDRRGDPPGAECVGRVVDAVRRCLGLATAPPATTVHDLAATLWLHRVHARALDGGPIDRTSVDALAPGMPTSWAHWREQCATGAWPELDIDPHHAAWMDDGMFSREATGAFPDPAEVLLELGEVLSPPVWEHLVTALAGRACATGY